MKINCACGNVFERSLNEYSVCTKCSSVYSKSGILMVSRHNWNFNEFFELRDQKKFEDLYKKCLHLNQH